MSAINKIQQDKNQVLYHYWNKLRDNRKAPHRFEIEPAKIAHILPNTFILQHEQKNKYEFRLAGTAICHEFCFELKQSNILEFWNQNDSEAIRSILGNVENDAALGAVDFTATAKNGQTVDYEMLIMPLYHNNMHISRMLGGLVAKSKPYWLGTSMLESFQVTKISLFWPDKDYSAPEIHHSNTTPFPVDPVTRPAAVSPLTDLDYKIVTAKDRKFRVYESGRDNS